MAQPTRTFQGRSTRTDALLDVQQDLDADYVFLLKSAVYQARQYKPRLQLRSISHSHWNSWHGL